MGLSLSADESHRTTPNVSVALKANDSTTTALIGNGSTSPQNNSPDIQATSPETTGNQTLSSNDLSKFVTMDVSTPTSGNSTITPSNGTAASDEDFRFNFFGTYVYPSRWLTLPTLYSWIGSLSSLAMIIGCVLPYVPQYVTIQKKQNCGGFSTFVCLTLLLSNILRIAFWFGQHFELPMLIQSVVMILAQILLLELCVRVKRQNISIPFVRRTFFSFNLRYFWRWTDLTSYLEFLFIITALLGVAVYFLIDCKPFVESLGYCATVSESMLALPLVIKNYRKKSVAGMSLLMVLMLLAGDIFKTGYYIVNALPHQFLLCGLTQITIDLLILFQVCLFKQNAPMKMSPRVDNSPKEMMAL